MERKSSVKHSIRRQLALVFMGLTVAVILCCFLANTLFLEKYYTNNKKRSLMEVYGKLGASLANDTLETEEVNIELQNLCGKYNISMLLLDEDFQTRKATMQNSEFLKNRILDRIFFPGKENENDKILEQSEQYVMYESIDSRMHEGYIEMWGFIGENNFFLLRTPREGIRDSVAIANRFLAYVGILAVFASGIVIWFVSKRVTEPVLTLADISAKMSGLDFNTKYEGNSKNEIGLLGDNINRLSETLEQTFSELKTVNNELKNDMEKKTRIDEMRKEFLSNVSHELKTPIALIQGYAEGLKEGVSEDAESREYYCDVIMDEANKMNLMVKKLLTLNQLEFGNEEVTMELFDIMELITTFVQSAEIFTSQKGITVKIDGNFPCRVWGDEYKTEEVFRNYFSNAMNYCTGEKVIHVKVTERESKMRISVFNTGSPIPEEAIPHLWEKFYKVDKARTREYGGSGIGLSVVKAIMDSMNEAYGVINYENGVEFWFELSAN